MKSVKVHIKEKDKGSKELTLLNLRDEVVNFLYKDTLAHSTRADMQFFVLVYFALLPVNDKSALEAILDEALPKFKRLNRTFQKKQGYLRANEYRQRVEEQGLSDIFKNDIFFILVDSILNIDTIEVHFAAFISENKQLAKVFDSLKANYRAELEESFLTFRSSKIEDDRYDDDGNYHDLSKSVYRTIRMRNARNLELNLQKYTTVKQITSNSPLDLIFFQHIDPQIIFDLWDKYHVAEYMTQTVKVSWELINSNIGSGALLLLIGRYVRFKRVNGAKDPKGKRAAKKAFEEAKNQASPEIEKLNMRLVDSVLRTNKRLEKEIKDLRREKRELEEKNAGGQKDDEIKKLKERVRQLENLVVETKVVEDED